MKPTNFGILLVLVTFSFLLNNTSASEVEELFSSSISGNVESILELVNKGISVDSPNKGNATPLWMAVNWNQTQSVKTLLMLGANPNLAAYGKSPLFVAVGRDTEILKALIKHGADVNTTTVKGSYSPLGRAAGNRLSTFESLKSRGSYKGPFPDIIKTVKFLIQAGAAVNHVDLRQSSPLRNAIRVNNYNVAKILLENGADIHQKIDDTTSRGSQSGNTILMEAIFWFGIHNKLDLIELLLSNGANPNDLNSLEYDEDCAPCNWNGYSVLTYSADKGYHEVVKLLLANGANPTIPRQDGKTALEIAIEDDDQKLIQILSTE